MLNAVSPPRESSNLEIGLGTSSTPTNRKPLRGVKIIIISWVFRLRIHNQQLFFLCTLYFKIIVDLQKLQKEYRELRVHFSRFLPIDIFYVSTISKEGNQHWYVCAEFYDFLSCVDSCNYYDNKNSEGFYHKDLLQVAHP